MGGHNSWPNMNPRSRMWVLLVPILILAPGVMAEEQRLTLVEGKGITDVGLLGENIKNVQAVWGKADRAAKDDWPYSPYVFHEYHQEGALFTTNQEGNILDITIYCNTGDKEPFHKTGLMWMNPSATYQTFQGITSKGLQFKDRLTPEEVYGVYGKPEMIVELGIDVQTKQREGKPFILDMGKAGFSINYPEHRMSCTVFGEFVESCTILEDG